MRRNKVREKIAAMAGIVVPVLLLCGVLSGCNGTDITDDKGNTGDKTSTQYAMGDVVSQQEAADRELISFQKDEKYTLEEARVVINPYGIAPLTALIIFHTPTQTAISVDINGKRAMTTERAEHHSIPIYGLRDGAKNEIRLTDEDGNSADYTVETEPFQGNRLEVEKTSKSLGDSLFLLSPNFTSNCVYDREGNLLWYLENGYAGDIEFLDNGHFYISDPWQGTNGVKINYASFLEMDYLGKIHRQFIAPMGYHHELYPMGGDRMLLTGARDGSPFLEAILYVMDMRTGEPLRTIDMYQVFHDIAPKWVESLGNDFDFVLNSIDYDEDSGDVLLSFRGFGVIARMNLESAELRWMIGDPANLPKEFEPWLLDVTDGTKYPYGEHCATFTEEGDIAFHNNDADQFHMQSEKLTDYLDRYSTNVVLRIDEENRTAETLWEYNSGEKEFSKVAGMLELMSGGHKLIVYGWSVTQDAYRHPEDVTINDAEYLNGIIEELDEDDKLLFRAATKDLLYRAYKMNFYENQKGEPVDTAPYEVRPYEKINGTPVTIQKQDIGDLEEELKNAPPLDGKIDVLVNRAILEMKTESKEEDAVDILFRQEDSGYIYSWKKAGEEEYKGFNSEIYGIPVSIPDGAYELYVRAEGQWYNAHTVVIF